MRKRTHAHTHTHTQPTFKLCDPWQKKGWCGWSVPALLYCVEWPANYKNRLFLRLHHRVLTQKGLAHGSMCGRWPFSAYQAVGPLRPRKAPLQGYDAILHHPVLTPVGLACGLPRVQCKKLGCIPAVANWLPSRGEHCLPCDRGRLGSVHADHYA